MPTWGGILAELNAARVPGKLPPVDDIRRKYLAALAKRTGRSAILYASRWTSPGGSVPGMISVTPEDMQGFMEVVHQLPSDGLDLIVHSPGGSAEATEAIVKYLRSKFNDIRVVVPHAAMSAATMLACSANRILLGKHSFLGPIDPQLLGIGESGAPVAAHAILEQFKLAQDEIKASPELLRVWLPILQKYGPALIIQCKLAQQLSESLVEDWLAKYMFAGDATGPAKANRIAHDLADHAKFKSHSRFIDRAQLTGWGLVIEDLEKDQDVQDLVLSVFHAAMHTFNMTGCQKIIENHNGKAWVKAQAQQQIVMVPPPAAGGPLPLPFPLPGSPGLPIPGTPTPVGSPTPGGSGGPPPGPP